MAHDSGLRHAQDRRPGAVGGCDAVGHGASVALWRRQAAVVVLVAALVGGGPVHGNPIPGENLRPPSRQWLAEEAQPPEIEAYSSVVSLAPGGTVGFHVSTKPAAAFRILVYRIGWYGGAGGTLLTCLPDCESHYQGSPLSAATYGLFEEIRADWPVAATLRVPQSWVSGYYLANVTLTSGPGSGTVDRVPFIVRDPPGRQSQILGQVPVNTWQAYNGWGGKSLYEHSSTGGRRAVAVSFDRPYFIGPGRQEMTDWELALVRWLERQGYDVSYQTNVDTHRDPDTLNEHRLVLTLGHDEYWTKEMRDGFEAARAAGTNLGFLGANAAYWQIRYADDERTIISYKSLYDPEPRIELKTALFREVGRPECALLGVQHQGGLQNWGRHDYLVTAAGAADPWAAGTGFAEGSRIVGVVSVERDTVPSIGCGNPTVLFRYDAGGDELGDAAAVRYMADSGARVFSTGTMELGWALDAFPAAAGEGPPVDVRLQKFMTNAVDDLTRPAAARRVVATDLGGSVKIEIEAAGDKRVRWDVFRHPGAGGRGVEDPDVTVVCRRVERSCVDLEPTNGQVRYGAVAVDQWSQSAPRLSDALVVRRTSGPRDGTIVVARQQRTVSGGATYDLFTIDLRTRRARRLTRGTRAELQPAWSHDGRVLAFTSAGRVDVVPPSPSRGSTIFVVDRDGNGLRRVTAVHSHTWGPDGTRLALARGDAIYIADVATGKARRLTRGTKPSWSKRGRIAFVRDRKALWTINARGGQPRLLLQANNDPRPDGRDPAPERAYVDSPSWSPDGRQIAFIDGRVPDQERGAVERVHVADARGRTRRTYDADISRPSWSHDGRWIVGATNGGRICALPIARPHERTCLRLPGPSFDPAWARARPTRTHRATAR